MFIFIQNPVFQALHCDKHWTASDSLPYHYQYQQDYRPSLLAWHVQSVPHNSKPTYYHVTTVFSVVTNAPRGGSVTAAAACCCGGSSISDKGVSVTELHARGRIGGVEVNIYTSLPSAHMAVNGRQLHAYKRHACMHVSDKLLKYACI
jgi:hypothetical protein